VPAPSIAAAFREFVPVMLRQRRDTAYFIHRELPISGVPISGVEVSG